MLLNDVEPLRHLLRLALVILHELTEAAKRSDLTDSMKQSWNGATLMNISVLELPPRQGISKCVNFELRYGMCSWSCISAMMTLVSSLSDLLIFFVSSIRVLVFGLSDPAKSTKLMVPIEVSPFPLCVPISMRRVTACDRDDRSLPAVEAVARFDLAICISSRSRLAESTVTSVMLDT